MKSPEGLAASIERFRRGFWDREAVDRPPVGIAPDRGWLPVNYLKAPFPRAEVRPDDVGPEVVRTDYEDAALHRRVRDDDWIPYNAAWRAVPWLEAICGCRVPYAEGSLSAEPYVESAGEIAALTLPASAEWRARLLEQTRTLVEACPPDCFVSPSILRGSSDVLGALRGLTGFFLDLYDAPQAVAAAVERVNSVLLDVLADHFALVSQKEGGYGYIYGYWAPGPTVVIQQDMMGMCSPEMYARLFMEEDARLVERLGPYTLFHLHATGYGHYRHVLDLPGLAGLELTLEAAGPPLRELVPMLREVLERTRLILFVDAHFGDLREALRQLPADGLYLMVSDKFVSSDEEFRELCTSVW